MAVISRNTVFWFMNDFGRCAHPKSLPQQELFVAQVLIKKVKLKCCGI
jgi:hypothetical protein